MLAKWNPVANLAPRHALSPALSFMDEADDLMRSVFSTDSALLSGWNSKATLGAAAEILEDEQRLAIHVDLPGHDPNSIQVRVEGDTLTLQSQRTKETSTNDKAYVRSERSYGSVARSFILPKTVDASKCEAQYQHGVLSLTFPKREEAKPRAIEVKINT